MSLKSTTQSFLKKSQSKISSLKRRLNALMTKEKELEKEEKSINHKIEKPGHEVKVVLSVDSVIKATIAVLGVIGMAYLLYFLKDIILLFLVALFIAAAFNPAVDFLEKYRIPRSIGIVLMYLLVLGIITLVFTSLVPVIAVQVSNLALSIRDYIQTLVSGDESGSWFIRKIHPVANQIWQNLDQAQILNSLATGLKEIGTRLTGFAGNALGALFTIFNGLLNMVLVLILSFFMVINKRHTSDFFCSLFPHKYSAYISEKTKEASVKIGEWIRGQLLLSLGMGILTFIVFTVIGLNFALTLAMVSALAEFLPYLGPAITFLAAALIALNQDPMLVLWLIPATIVIQFIESNIMAPLIVGRSVGLNPIIIFFAFMAGAALGWKLGDSVGYALIGMIISVPLANIISIFVRDYTGKNK